MGEGDSAGDPMEDLRLHLYCDADFAGCNTTNRCTAGVFLAIEGPHTWFPVGAGAKKLYITCNSTTEAELCAGSHGLRQVGLPGSILWDVITGCIDPSLDDQQQYKTGVPQPAAGGTTAGGQIGYSGRQLTPSEIILRKREVRETQTRCEESAASHHTLARRQYGGGLD